MNRYKSSAELKDLAKEKLAGNYGIVIAAFLVIEAISYLASSLLSTRGPGAGLGAFLLSLLITSVVSVFVGLFHTGFALLFLNIACGQHRSVEDIFYGIKNQPGRSLVVSLANALVSLVCMSPYQIFAALFFSTQNTSYLLLMFVSMVIGLLIYVPVSLSISQSYYLLLDFPEYTGKEVLRASCKIMKGHKRRLFYIEVSFFPLLLLSILTLGIGLLWLTPYMNMTYTLFFLDIMNPRKAGENN